MLEKKIQANIIKKFRQLGALAVKVESQSTAGWPDLACLHQGRSFYIEVKTPTGRLSAIQKHVISEIKSHGGEVYVCTSVEEAVAALEGQQC